MPTIGPVQVANNLEDGGYQGNASFDPNGPWSAGLLMGMDGNDSNYRYEAGVSFLNITIPADAVISSCTLELYYDNEKSGTPDLTIYVGDYFDAPQWSGQSVKPDNIDRAPTGVNWLNPGTGTWVPCPDLSVPLQEVVNSQGGIDGRLSFAFLNNVPNGQHFINYNDYGENSANAARLTIEYMEPGDGLELYRPTWPTELLWQAQYRVPPPLRAKIFKSRMIRGVK